MAEEQWHFMDEDERERFLMTWLPMHAGLHDLLADLRFGGYRILSDLICDIDDENTARDRKRLIRDSDWVVLPVSSFDAYFGTTSFGRKYLRLIPGEILERPDSGLGVCRYRVREEYQI